MCVCLFVCLFVWMFVCLFVCLFVLAGAGTTPQVFHVFPGLANMVDATQDVGWVGWWSRSLDLPTWDVHLRILLCVFGWRPVLNLGSAIGRTGNCFFVVYMFRWKHGNFLKHPWDLLCWQTTYQPRGKYTKTNFLGRGSKWLCTCTKDRERKGFPQKDNPSKTFWTREIYFDGVSYAVLCIIFFALKVVLEGYHRFLSKKTSPLDIRTMPHVFSHLRPLHRALSFSDTEIDEVVAISDTERDDFVAISDTERDEVVASEVSRKCAGCSFSRCHRACIVRVLFTTSYFRLSATSKAEVRPSVATQHSWLPSSPCSLTGFILKTCSHGSWCLFTPHKVGALSCLCV